MRLYCTSSLGFIKKTVLRIRIRSDPVFLGHTDPDLDPGKYRIRILYLQKDPCMSNFIVK